MVFCSGKHYYALAKHREAKNLKDVAIVRLEVSERFDWERVFLVRLHIFRFQALCPFPAAELQHELRKYKNAISKRFYGHGIYSETQEEFLYRF